ncbi:hypothetical protein AB0I72_11375 [Nocardiopsis sp. NPDC049922]|uniref:hypothetical protein n=1 Tax=Nocardiopsis sp. NPDC049922 TaxID=3155157 RepID=UPI0034111818
MDIDWPRTLTTGGLTLALLVAVAVADYLEAARVGDIPAGPVPVIGGLAGIVVGLAVANAVLG